MGEPLTSAVKIAPFLGRIVKWLWRWRRPDTSVAALATHVDELAELVQREEIKRLAQLGVVRGEAVNVSFDVLVHVRAAGGADIGTLAEVAQYYRELRTGRLVVLGEPGAGKTVVALHLLLDVLEHRHDREGKPGPIPLRVNAASWDTACSFTDWLTGILASQYSLQPRVARQLIETGRALPVLDGLDEMDPPDASPDRARQALDQLNENPWRGRAVIVMCRSDVYEAARALRGDGGDSGLHAATAVTLRPLTVPEIQRHLDDSRKVEGLDPKSWAPVTKRLIAEPPGVLAEALSTPWLLTLAVASLRRGGCAAAEELAAAHDLESVQDILFAALIPAAVKGLPQHDRGRRRYTDEQKVHRWLQNLARHLESRRDQPRGGTDVALHELWEMAGRRTARCLHGVIVGLVVWFAVGVLALLIAFAESVDLVEGVAWPAFVVVIGLVMGLVTGLARSTAPRRILWATPRTGDLRRQFDAGNTVGLRVTYVLTLIFWFIFLVGSGPETTDVTGVVDLLVHGLVWGSMTGLVIGLGVALVTTDKPALSERRIIRDDALAALTVGLTFALTIALTAGLTVGLPELPVGLVAGFILGLPFGLGVGIVLAAATVRYTCATVLFACKRTFPARPAAFLDWAQDAGLLRVTGAAYQYRHETFRRWLIEHPPGSRTPIRPEH